MDLKYGPYSPSRMATGACGYSFYNQYIKEEKQTYQENLAAARGAAVHEVFERITAAFKINRDHVFNPSSVREWIKEAVNNHPAAYQEIDTILEMCKRYIARPILNLTDDAGIELKLAVKASFQEDGSVNFSETEYDDPNAFVRGRSDVLILSDNLKSATIVDHKTQPNIEEANTFQMGVYGWVVWKIHPYLEEIKTVLHFARYGSYSDETIWSLDDLRDIEEQLLTKISIIEGRTSWEPQANKLCQYCPFLATCPTMKEFIEVDPETGTYSVNQDNLKCFGDTNKAVKLAGLLHILEESVKVCKEDLSQHVKLFGPIALYDKIAWFKPTTDIDYKKANSKKRRESIYKIFESYDVDVKQFMIFNKSSMKNAFLLDKPDLIRSVSQVLQETITTKTNFKLHSK